MGDDLSVVNSARVSFGKRSETLTDADEGLIRYLMRERHGTPFEHNSFRFHVVTPVFVAREWFRHRIGSFNELSGRYTEIPERWWWPAPEDVRKRVGKPGAYTYEPFDTEDESRPHRIANLLDMAGQEAFRLYSRLLAGGVAPEQARVVLPLSMYTEFYWTLNARALMNFLSLRTDPTAMKEIRDFAEAVECLWAGKMPVTHQSWVDAGKTAP